MSSDDSEEENVIRYGTPLDPFEEDEVPSKRKFQQQPDQYAVDEHGRRRFHGAFTGGFSAGYGNTVGTPEGWTPSSFKSSRLEKAQFSNQRPEDFMDDEDRSEYGIAPRNIQTNNEFSGQKRPHRQGFHDGPIPGEPVLGQLIRTVHETAAVKMLRKMGWKEGQGVGDRLTKSDKKRAKDQHKVYGCFMPPEMRQDNKEQSDDSSDSEFEYETLFAPDDYEPYILQRKNDHFGLGYKGLSRHSVLGNLVGEYDSAGSSKSHLIMKEKGKKVSIRGQAFGVGAFEADDEDVYATEDMSHYDFALGGATDQTIKKSVPKSSNVLQGFVKASKAAPPLASYPPPALPRDFAPAPAGHRRSRFEPSEAPQRDQGLGRHELTAEARGALLGETPLPKTQPETNTQTQNPNVTKLLEKSINFVTENTKNDKDVDFISIKDTGKDINVFKPFVSDPKKQARYEKYLEDKNSVGEADGDVTGDRLSEWEKNRELVEFEQAAKLYRPLSGVMGDRFTHASEPDEALNPLTAVAKSSVNYGLATPEQIEAAKMGAYGAMTRRETIWQPEAIVCKRFNVPELGGRVEPKKDEKSKVSYSIFSYLESSVHDKESFTKEQSKFSGSKSLTIEPKQNIKNNDKINEVKQVHRPIVSEVSTGPNKRMTVAELFMKESEKDLQTKAKETEIVPTIEKFDRMDLYKSIFLSDSENEEGSKETGTDYKDFVDKPKNIERNTSPPRGIFANIDFDELNSWRRHSENNNSSTNENTKDKTDAKDISNEKIDKNNSPKEEIDTNDKSEEKTEITPEPEAIYGPKIPENLQKRLEVLPENNFKPVFRTKDERELDESSSSDSWVEAKVKPKKDKKKKNKKHKSKKKSKHKKKDR